MQSDIHPDAESLNAFVEHTLEASEREQVLAHLAKCGRCRQVVFLAHEAAAVEQMEEVAVAAAQPVKARRSRFMNWRLAWVPIAALAGFVAFAVVQHSRRVPTETQVAKSVQNETTVAKNAPPEPAIVATPSATPPTTTKEVRQKTAHAPARRDSAAQANPQDAPSLSFPMALAKSSASSLQQGSSLGSASTETGVGGSLHGSVQFGSATKSIGGPAFTDKLKKERAEQQQTLAIPQLNSAQLSGIGAGRAGAATRTTDAKSAMGQASVSAATPDSATLCELAPQPMANKDSNNAIEKEALATNPKVTMLPSGLAAISVATAAVHTVAIDPAGAMYVSEDEGKHWSPVSRQWTGRAILVTNHEYSLQTTAVPLPQGSHFELVNDTFKKWLSPDGKSWSPVSDPVQ
jgi:hypothetical protein